MESVFNWEEVHLRDYLYILRKHRLVVAFFFSFVLAAAVVYTLSEKVLYRGSATILIERENPNVVDFKEVMALDASTTDYYQTQYQMLKSRSLIETLIKQENLEEDPYFLSLREGGLRKILRKTKVLRRFSAEPMSEDVFIKKMLKVDPVRNSRLVYVSVLYPDPARSAELTNHLVDLFIKRNIEARFQMAIQATELISGQLGEMKDKVAESEKKLQDYKEQHGLVKIPSIREKNEFIQDAKLELVKIQADESKLAKRYLPAHPKRIHIRSQIEGLQEKIDEEEKKLLETGRTALDYAELEREAESSGKIYESLLSRLQETSSEARTQASNIIVVDRAQPPPRPYKPRPLLNFLIAVFLGGMGGVLLAFFVEYLDSTVKIPEDIEKGLGLDLFGIIPTAERSKNVPLGGELFFRPQEPSTASESFRALRTALLFKLRSHSGCRILLVTSPNPEEGKTTVALNLAAAFQQNHLKVLLIDADLRKPKLHRIFGLPSEKGLTEMLEGELPFETGVHKNVEDLGFDFLSCGGSSHHPTELLGSQSMKELVSYLRVVYDVVVIDSPPYLAVADVAVLSEYTQAMMVVARYHKTDRRHLRNVRRRFNFSDDKTMGVVINQVSVREKDYYYHQYYYYGYGDSAKPR